MSKLIQDWKQKVTSILNNLHPDLNLKEVHLILDEVLANNFKNPKAILHNNYLDDQTVSANLENLYNWIEYKHPICAGNGTFFYNQEKVSSPLGKLIDDRQADRKRYQQIRDQYDKDSYEYKHYDMLQMEAKIKINSIYGAFGAATFQLFNLYTASATTASAQSLISTTAICFEAFLTNSVKFENLDQCLVFLDNIITEDRVLSLDGIDRVESSEIVYRRIRATFKDFDKSYEAPIRRVLKHCDNDTLTRIYYKNNIYPFIESPYIHNLLTSVYNNTESFRDPNKPDENIKPILDEIWEYFKEFVYYDYFFVERIRRLKQDKRQSVTLIDTDSNVINIHPWVKYNRENVWADCNSKMEFMDMKFTAVNTIAFLITKVVQTILIKYCTQANMLEEFFPKINMKNEFYFPKMLLADVKKRYVGSIRLKEGREIYPEKIEIKGHDFKKAGVTQETTKVMESIIAKNILNEDVETVDIVGILDDISAFEKEIRRSLDNGEKTYLLRMKAKSPESYENDPFRHRQVVGVYNWNSLYPDNEIETSAIINVALTKDITPEVMEKYKTKYPHEYDRMQRFIFNHRDKKIHNGIVCIAIPNNIEKMPEFIREFIDADYIVSRNINTFRPIMSALGLPGVKGSDITTASGGKKKTEAFSNIIDL